MTGAQLKDELDALEEKLDGKGFVGYGETPVGSHSKLMEDLLL